MALFTILLEAAVYAVVLVFFWKWFEIPTGQLTWGQILGIVIMVLLNSRGGQEHEQSSPRSVSREVRRDFTGLVISFAIIRYLHLPLGILFQIIGLAFVVAFLKDDKLSLKLEHFDGDAIADFLAGILSRAVVIITIGLTYHWVLQVL